MSPWLWSANVIGWPVIQIAIGGVMVRMPASRFSSDCWITRERRFEQAGALYRRGSVHAWKRRLPDGAPWVGGVSKKRLDGRSREVLEAFLIETRRAEIAHWYMLLCTFIFFLWNPVWACVVMTFYGIAANVPCILAQRANRIQLARVLLRGSNMQRRHPRAICCPGR